jgi:hypothetical protein
VSDLGPRLSNCKIFVLIGTFLCVCVCARARVCGGGGNKKKGYIRGCIQKFRDWQHGVRTANGTALCH